MATDRRAQYKLDPLDDENYASWAKLAKAVLMIERFWPMIEQPDGYSSNAVKESDAYARLLTLVGMKKVNEVAQFDSPKDAWEHLESTYASKMSARKLQLEKELIYIDLGKHKTIDKYFERINEIVNSLKIAGMTVEQRMVKRYALHGLTKDYDSVIEVLSAWIDEDSKTLADMHARLLVTEERVNPPRDT
jgi:hypothetical protein